MLCSGCFTATFCSAECALPHQLICAGEKRLRDETFPAESAEYFKLLLQREQYPALDLALSHLSPLELFGLSRLAQMEDLRAYLSRTDTFRHLFHVRAQRGPNLVSAMEQDVLDALDEEAVNYWQLWLTAWYAANYEEMELHLGPEIVLDIWNGHYVYDLVFVSAPPNITAIDYVTGIFNRRVPYDVDETEAVWFIDSIHFDTLLTALLIPRQTLEFHGLTKIFERYLEMGDVEFFRDPHEPLIEPVQNVTRAFIAYRALRGSRNCLLRHGEMLIRGEAN